MGVRLLKLSRLLCHVCEGVWQFLVIAFHFLKKLLKLSLLLPATECFKNYLKRLKKPSKPKHQSHAWFEYSQKAQHFKINDCLASIIPILYLCFYQVSRVVQLSVVLNIRSMNEDIIQVVVWYHTDFRNSSFPSQLDLELDQLCFHRITQRMCFNCPFSHNVLDNSLKGIIQKQLKLKPVSS